MSRLLRDVGLHRLRARDEAELVFGRTAVTAFSIDECCRVHRPHQRLGGRKSALDLDNVVLVDGILAHPCPSRDVDAAPRGTWMLE